MTAAASRTASPPGTAIQQAGNILVTLIEAERVSAVQSAEAKFQEQLANLERQKRDAEQIHANLQAEAAAHRKRIHELEEQNAILQAQIQEHSGQTISMKDAAGFLCDASNSMVQGTVDPRNLIMGLPENKPPSSTLPSAPFGLLLESGTILFQGSWVKFWKELAAAETSEVEDEYKKRMSPADLERLLSASLDVIRRTKEDRDHFAQSSMAPSLASELYGIPFINSES